MDAYWEAFTSNEAAYKANLQAIQNHLTKTRALPLSTEDLDGIAAVTARSIGTARRLPGRPESRCHQRRHRNRPRL